MTCSRCSPTRQHRILTRSRSGTKSAGIMNETLFSRWAAIARERGCFTECKSDSRRGQPQRSCGVSLDWCQSLAASMRLLLRDDVSATTESIVQKLFVPLLGCGARREQRWVSPNSGAWKVRAKNFTILDTQLLAPSCTGFGT